MSRERWIPQAGDYCLKGDERGRVVKRKSLRTGRTYLTVQILSWRRRGLHEFPEKGWKLDDGTATSYERSGDREGFIDSEYGRTKHHAPVIRDSGSRVSVRHREKTQEQIDAAKAQRARDEEGLPY